MWAVLPSKTVRFHYVFIEFYSGAIVQTVLKCKINVLAFSAIIKLIKEGSFKIGEMFPFDK